MQRMTKIARVTHVLIVHTDIPLEYYDEDIIEGIRKFEVDPQNQEAHAILEKADRIEVLVQVEEIDSEKGELRWIAVFRTETDRDTLRSATEAAD